MNVDVWVYWTNIMDLNTDYCLISSASLEAPTHCVITPVRLYDMSVKSFEIVSKILGEL